MPRLMADPEQYGLVDPGAQPSTAQGPFGAIVEGFQRDAATREMAQYQNHMIGSAIERLRALGSDEAMQMAEILEADPMQATGIVQQYGGWQAMFEGLHARQANAAAAAIAGSAGSSREAFSGILGAGADPSVASAGARAVGSDLDRDARGRVAEARARAQKAGKGIYDGRDGQKTMRDDAEIVFATEMLDLMQKDPSQVRAMIAGSKFANWFAGLDMEAMSDNDYAAVLADKADELTAGTTSDMDTERFRGYYRDVTARVRRITGRDAASVARDRTTAASSAASDWLKSR